MFLQQKGLMGTGARGMVQFQNMMGLFPEVLGLRAECHP